MQFLVNMDFLLVAYRHGFLALNFKELVVGGNVRQLLYCRTGELMFCCFDRLIIDEKRDLFFVFLFVHPNRSICLVSGDVDSF